jgi:Transmembrane exosortase (Exosortase_EpsH)
MQRLSLLGSFLLRERHWIFLGLVYLAAWIIPFQWMKEYWLLDYQVTSSQPFVLLGFAFALCGNRKRLLDAWETVKRNERYAKKVRSEGTLTFLLIGCVLYFFAHFSRLALVGILGLVLMLVGVLLRVFGKRSLSSIPGPLTYLFLIVPWLPETALGAINQQVLKVYLILASALLFRIGFYTQQIGEVLLVKGVQVPLSFQLYGAQGIFTAIVFFWAYGLTIRLPRRRIFLHVFVGTVVAFLVHLSRILAVCLISPSNLRLGTLLSSASPWIFSLLSLAITFLALKISARIRRPQWLAHVFHLLRNLSNAIQRPLDRVLSGAAVTGKGVGKGLTVLVSPLIWFSDKLLKGFEQLFKLLGKSNKMMEKMFIQSDRKRNQRRRKK